MKNTRENVTFIKMPVCVCDELIFLLFNIFYYFYFFLSQVDRPTANWMLWNGLGGLEVLTNTNHSCNAFVPAHCEVFPYLVNHSLVETALAEKDQVSGGKNGGD
jgi:hypothetical protein